MKLLKRPTAKRILTKKICSPEYTREGEKVKFLLSYVDEQDYRRTMSTSKDLFAFAAGENEEGQLPDGLDRLLDHQFVIHADENDKAIGLDIIPARLWRGVVPVKGAEVSTVRLEYLLGGMVCVVAHKPYKVRAADIIKLIAAIDKLIITGKPVTLTTKLPGIGKVQVVESDAIEIKLSAGQGSTKPMYDLPLDDA